MKGLKWMNLKKKIINKSIESLNVTFNEVVERGLPVLLLLFSCTTSVLVFLLVAVITDSLLTAGAGGHTPPLNHGWAPLPGGTTLPLNHGGAQGVTPGLGIVFYLFFYCIPEIINIVLATQIPIHVFW